jgi:hypothetical protein
LVIFPEGVYIKRSWIPFTGTVLVPFFDIAYFYVLSETEKGLTTESLIIGFHNQQKKEKKAGLTGLDKSVDEIIECLDFYANKIGFRNSGCTTNF